MQKDRGPGSRRSFKTTTVLACGLALASAVATAGAGPASAEAPGGSRVAYANDPGGRLTQIERAAQNESKATFKLTYASKSSGSAASQVTLEQKPPAQLFRSGSGEVLYSGKKTYYCSLSSPATCVEYGTPGQSPLAGLMTIYSASTYVDIMRGWQSLIAARVSGFRIDFSAARFAGQSSECVSWSYHGSSAKYCVTDKGILAYVGGSGSGSSSSFTLTFYSGKVKGSDFNLPKGAVLQKIP